MLPHILGKEFSIFKYTAEKKFKSIKYVFIRVSKQGNILYCTFSLRSLWVLPVLGLL